MNICYYTQSYFSYLSLINLFSTKFVFVWKSLLSVSENYKR